MKRLLSLAVVLGLFSTIGLVGCSEEAAVEKQTTITTPSGESTITERKEVESTGENPPINVDASKPATP